MRLHIAGSRVLLNYWHYETMLRSCDVPPMTQTNETQGALISAIDTASSTAAIRSLGKAGLRTVVISEHRNPPGFRSKYCDERIRVPSPNTDLSGYEQALLTLARREDVQTILPFREADIYILSRNREYFESHLGTPWPRLEILRQVQDRIKLRDIAATAGVAQPHTKTLENWTDWNRPCIVKPRYTMHAPEYEAEFTTPMVEMGSTRYLQPGEKPDSDEIQREMGHTPLVQEFVPTTDEYGFFALYDSGKPVATFQHRQRRGWKYAGGPSAYRESVSIPALENAGRALLNELDWHGVAMVEFLRDPESDQFKLMEINPRFWSSLPFTIQAGVDFPSLYWRQATGKSVDQPRYTIGIGGHLIRGELLHLHSILAEEYPLVPKPSLSRTTLDVFFSLLREPRFDYLSRDDPGPMRAEIVNMIRGGIEFVDSKPAQRVAQTVKTLTAPASKVSDE